MSGSDSPTFFHGQPWSSWIERIGRDKPLSDDEPEGEPSTSVTRLSSDDIDLYGFCPERDAFYGVVCEICNAIVKPQALIQHMESRHPSGTVNLPPPANPVVKPPVKTPYCKVSKLKKAQTTPQLPSSSKTNHSSVKRTADQANLQTTLPISSPCSPMEAIPVQAAVMSSSPVKSPGTSGQPRRKRLKTDRSLLKDREYDPDRHCGVWNDETGKPCTRSLTCKAHTVSLRRTVSGRSKTFDKLLAEHRAAKELPSRPAKVTVTGTVTLSSGNINPLGPNTPLSNNESDAPSSPPVLSLPDTYPLPKTKLEDDFADEELSLETSLANAAAAAAVAASSASSITTPISVVLPSLSPIPGSAEGSPVATLIPAAVSPVIPVVAAPLPTKQPVITTVLEGETPIEIDPETMNMYSPVSVYKDAKSQIVVQLPRGANSLQSPSATRSFQASSMPSLAIFDSDQLEQTAGQLSNGKKIQNHSSPHRQSKRNKHDYQQEYSTTAIQVEATTTSTPYPHFSDISWSNCHPEPLAVTRWLRITSSRIIVHGSHATPTSPVQKFKERAFLVD